MKKNVLFWVGVKSTDKHLREKHGDFKYLDISKKCVEWWCNKNNITFFPYETPSKSDTNAHKATWQRWFDMFDQLDSAKVDYDKIAVIDGSILIRWDCPNFFKLAEGQLTVFRSLENLRWITESIDSRNEFFNGFKFDLKKYIDCGFQIFDSSHKKFLQDLKLFYYNNYDEIMRLQDGGKGTDQSIYNYLLQIKKIKVNMTLPSSFMLNHLSRFDWFSYNWQLEKDKTPFFIKYGYMWKYSGFPNRGDRYNLMKQTWDLIKDQYK